MKYRYIMKSGSLKTPVKTTGPHPTAVARRFFSRALSGTDVKNLMPTYLGTRYENEKRKLPNGKVRNVRIQVVMYGHIALPRCPEVWEDK